MNRKTWKLMTLFAILLLVLAACGGNGENTANTGNSGNTNNAGNDAEVTDNAGNDAAAVDDTSTDDSGFQVPAIEEGKFNVAFVYVGPHDDGGWSQAHDVGREYVEANVENVHTAYVENVPEGADAEQVIRSLARKGFNVIFTDRKSVV